MTLNTIAEEVRALDAILAECGGEITDETADKAIDEWFNEIADNEGRKVDAYLGLIAYWESQASSLQMQADELEILAKFRANKAKRLKDRLRGYLQLTGRKEIITAIGRRVCLQGNGGKLPVLLSPEAEQNPLMHLPPELVQTLITHRADRDAIRERLIAGESVPGAYLGERGVQVKVR